MSLNPSVAISANSRRLQSCGLVLTTFATSFFLELPSFRDIAQPNANIFCWLTLSLVLYAAELRGAFRPRVNSGQQESKEKSFLVHLIPRHEAFIAGAIVLSSLCGWMVNVAWALPLAVFLLDLKGEWGIHSLRNKTSNTSSTAAAFLFAVLLSTILSPGYLTISSFCAGFVFLLCQVAIFSQLGGASQVSQKEGYSVLDRAVALGIPLSPSRLAFWSLGFSILSFPIFSSLPTASSTIVTMVDVEYGALQSIFWGAALLFLYHYETSQSLPLHLSIITALFAKIVYGGNPIAYIVPLMAGAFDLSRSYLESESNFSSSSSSSSSSKTIWIRWAFLPWLVMSVFFTNSVNTPASASQETSKWTSSENWKSWSPWEDHKLHPIQRLMEDAEAQNNKLLASQSRTVKDAVKEYRRRYQRNPPPNFEGWVQLALDNNVAIIDDWDTMTNSFEPFWKVPSSILRANIDGANNIHEHPWSNEHFITNSTLEKGVRKGNDYDLLPEMKRQLEPYKTIIPNVSTPLLINRLDIMDLPRVVIPWEMQQRIQKNIVPHKKYPNNWIRLADWPADTLLLGCPPESAARQEGLPADQVFSSELQIAFVENIRAAKSICNKPDLRYLHSFFGPGGNYMVTHRHLPFFSGTKTLINQDILFPSAYYGREHQPDPSADANELPFSEKKAMAYWTGSSTGGHIRPGFRWQDVQWQRERLVNNINSLNEVSNVTFLHRESASDPWTPYTSTTKAEAHRFDVRYARLVQCDDEPQCPSFKEHFKIPDAGHRDPRNTTSLYKFLIDVDGNGFSGRFYRLLDENAVVIKQTIFQETHDDFLIPWFHYVPLSIEGHELWEIIRWFSDTEEGATAAEFIAANGRRWVREQGRRLDTGAGLARALLEYARLVDENRDGLA